jgi:hypothetical protein
MATRHEKGHDKHSRLKTNAMMHLGTFQGVDQTPLAHIREADDADGDALRRARFVRLEAEQRRRGSRKPGHCFDADYSDRFRPGADDPTTI